MFRTKTGEMNVIEVLIGNLLSLLHLLQEINILIIFCSRGNPHNNRGSRSNNLKGDSSYKQGLRDIQENHQQHEHIRNL